MDANSVEMICDIAGVLIKLLPCERDHVIDQEVIRRKTEGRPPKEVEQSLWKKLYSARKVETPQTSGSPRTAR